MFWKLAIVDFDAVTTDRQEVKVACAHLWLDTPIVQFPVSSVRSRVMIIKMCIGLKQYTIRDETKTNCLLENVLSSSSF